jgi:hypothetical protein
VSYLARITPDGDVIVVGYGTEHGTLTWGREADEAVGDVPGTDLMPLPASGLPQLCAVCFLDGRYVGSIGTNARVQVCGRHANRETFDALLRVRTLLRLEGLTP